MPAFLLSSFLKNQSSVAIGLSGGPDSLALTHMLSQICATENLSTKIHALIVNHNLRPEAAEEAKDVQRIAANFPNTCPAILTWETPQQNARIMETARNARYELMTAYCKQHHIKYLYIAHHQDDQAETFLFRLAKGSGLDGLCGMQEELQYADDLTILRPLLDKPKSELMSYCQEYALPFLNDPSNQKEEYARPRLRKSREILEQEGLSSRRLALTAKRLSRAKDALVWLSQQAWDNTVTTTGQAIRINLDALSNYPEEIHFRVIKSAVLSMTPDRDYAPRMEKLEEIATQLFTELPFRKQTFAKLIFENRIKNGTAILVIEKECTNPA